MTLAAVVLALAAGLAWRVHRFGQRSGPLDGERAPVIVVLGARVLPDGSPSLALVARVEHAVALHQRRGGTVLFAGGGAPSSEAAVAYRLARALGLPAEAALLEERSRSTFENARFSVELLRPGSIDAIVLVTDDFHAYRAAAHFRRAGLRVISSPVRRTLSVGSRLQWTFREVAAVLRRPWLIH